MNIRYGNGHGPRSINTQADSSSDAKSKVRTEAGRMLGEDDVVFIACEDGIYAYLSQEDADADQTGASAFAVISIEE